MDLLTSLQNSARSLDEAAFARRNEGRYLLGQYPAASDDMWSFSTDIRYFDHGMKPPRNAGAQMQTPQVRFLEKVEKTNRNTWARRISVGRATNNDVIIRHDSVSKLHAHFHYGTMVRIDDSHDATLVLEDVGSANGTRVNGTPLVTDEPVPVYTGDRVEFGDIKCQFLDATALYHALQ